MIRQIRVQNFKSIRDVTVELTPVTVLVGKSGTGKSNFVDSIRFLRDILRHKSGAKDESYQKWEQSLKRDWPRIVPATANKGNTRFDITFSIPGIREDFSYHLVISPEGPIPAPEEESLKLGDSTLFQQRIAIGKHRQKESQWVNPPELVIVPSAGPLAIGRIPSISEIVIAFTALTSGIGCYTFADDVLCHEHKRPLGSTNGLNDDASNFLNVLKDAVSNLHDLSIRRSIVGALQRINSTVSSAELDSLQVPSHIVVGHKFLGKTLELRLSQESSGFRRFFAHLLALYQQPPKQTSIFEHPEDGIHPGAMSLLAEEIKAASEDGRGQVLLTTHNPELLEHFDVNEIRVVELDELETHIGMVSPEQREAIQEQLMDTGELLTVDPARIANAAEASNA